MKFILGKDVKKWGKLKKSKCNGLDLMFKNIIDSIVYEMGMLLDYYVFVFDNFFLKLEVFIVCIDLCILLVSSENYEGWRIKNLE